MHRVILLVVVVVLEWKATEHHRQDRINMLLYTKINPFIMSFVNVCMCTEGCPVLNSKAEMPPGM